MKSPLTPLVDFSATIPTLKKMIPRATEVGSYLFFDGHLEFNLSQDNRFIHAHTNKFLIHDFWKCVSLDPQRIIDMVNDIHPFDDQIMCDDFQKRILSLEDPFVRSALVFLLNHCSDSPYISRGTYIKENFNPIALSAFRTVEMSRVHVHYKKSDSLVQILQEQPNMFCSIVAGGHFSYNFFEEGKNKGVVETTTNHKQLKTHMQRSENRWIVLYKFHPNLKEIYKHFNIHMLDHLGRPITDEQSCEDLVIANF
tara:strand:+ start:108 stop:869 length:762 start_codon:yes stop_codon:yes gene_type:complete